MKKMQKLGLAAFSVVVTAVAILGVQSATAIPPGRCICLAIIRPVICSNGVVYQNDCYARCARATGCVPFAG